MPSSLLSEMPADLPQRIHDALRAWHQQTSESILDDLLLAHADPEGREGATPRLTSNQILLNGLERLKQVAGEDAADLLQRRFLSQETAQEVAFRRNVSENIIFQHQRVVIAQLADVIWAQEQELRQARLRLIDSHLEPPTYSRLFGAAGKLAEIREWLERPQEPWILALEGLGGIGKTSLADALARELAGSVRFREIGWISARRRQFRLSGEIETPPGQSDLSMAELVDRLVDQFGLDGLTHHSDTEKWLGLKDYLRSRPCLVVIDNLETVPDYPAFVSRLAALAGPSKFLLTTRHSLRDSSGIYIITLGPLSKDDTLAMVRYEAGTRGLPELAAASDKKLAPIHAATGGNPLAVKLIIGQVHSLSLPTVLSRFKSAKGKPFSELLTFLYETAWETLDASCRRVLQALTLVAEGGGRLEQIAAAADLDEGQAAACLHRLAVLSLVNVGGGLHERRYSLHSLTQAFVARQS
jgi:DNA polymerase III delta prime subunit